MLGDHDVSQSIATSVLSCPLGMQLQHIDSSSRQAQICQAESDHIMQDQPLSPWLARATPRQS